MFAEKTAEYKIMVLEERLTRLNRKLEKCQRGLAKSWCVLVTNLLNQKITGMECAWLRFFYPEISIRHMARLLDYPKSTLYDRMISAMEHCDAWAINLYPMVETGNYHFIRIVFAYELLYDDKLTLKAFCQMYDLSYHTVRQYINVQNTLSVTQYADRFYCNVLMSTAYLSMHHTSPSKTLHVMNRFIERHPEAAPR
ncbi:hypothetical protein ACTQ7D_004272 [Vibrio fluvialis]|uniref:hypothetical protein n=1 Tax=Vibrio fluvialis TaxID=676 RepID=UPI0015586606|nr:hypothetical protein [Vibrio fluvialis]EKO3474541.1 hypothetical protein [Vibrio fluvialis]